MGRALSAAALCSLVAAGCSEGEQHPVPVRPDGGGGISGGQGGSMAAGRGGTTGGGSGGSPVDGGADGPRVVVPEAGSAVEAGRDASGVGPDASSDGGTSDSEDAGRVFVDMAPPMLSPIGRGPAGQWEYHEIAGAMCRDGSPAGFYTRFSDTSKSLVIYLEQGGACFHEVLCNINPASVADSIVGRTIAGIVPSPGVMQAPTQTGIFDFANTANPFREWNMVWVPYCTGDVHAGSEPNGSIPNVTGVQHFVGYQNMSKFVGHIVPTFADADRVVLTGTSAGSFGAGLNYNQVQDAFGSVPVTLVMDSGVPFSDAYMAPCLQQMWRQYWNVGAALPPDCAECSQPDGGGMTNLFAFSANKYPKARVAVISSVDDEIMGLILGAGENDCALVPGFPPGKYGAALDDLRLMGSARPGHFASYYIPGTVHMYTPFDDFYTPLAGGVPLVDFVNDVLAGTMNQVGP